MSIQIRIQLTLVANHFCKKPNAVTKNKIVPTVTVRHKKTFFLLNLSMMVPPMGTQNNDSAVAKI